MMKIESVYNPINKLRSFETDLDVVVNKPVIGALQSWFGMRMNPLDDFPFLTFHPPSWGKNQIAYLRAAVWGNDKLAPSFKSVDFMDQLKQRARDLDTNVLIGNTHFVANLVRKYIVEKKIDDAHLLVDFGLGGYNKGRIRVDLSLLNSFDKAFNGYTDESETTANKRKAAFTFGLGLTAGNIISSRTLTEIVATDSRSYRLFRTTNSSYQANNEYELTGFTEKPARLFLNATPNCISLSNDGIPIISKSGGAARSYVDQGYIADPVNPQRCLYSKLTNRSCSHLAICRRPGTDNVEQAVAESFLKYIANIS